MDYAAGGPTKRLRLTGHRFDGGRLPVDSLVELQSYQEAVRAMAEYEWLRDHPDEVLPNSFHDSVSLTIERIEEGSADVFLAFETVAIYQEYQSEARDAVDATVQAAYSGADLPELPEDAQDDVRYAVANIGRTLSAGQSIEYYIGDDPAPILITVETRQSAVGHLLLSDFFREAPPRESPSGLKSYDETVVAHVIAIDADSMMYVLRDVESRTIRGRYKNNPGLLEDLRAVVDSEREGPLTRVSGELQYRQGEPWRFRKTYDIERVEFDETPWGRSLFGLATLPRGWAGGAGLPVSSVALDAAQAVMRQLTLESAPTIGATEDGGVLLEWISDTGVRSVEILPDGTFELFQMARGDRTGTQAETGDARRAAAFASGASE